MTRAPRAKGVAWLLFAALLAACDGGGGDVQQRLVDAFDPVLDPPVQGQGPGDPGSADEEPLAPLPASNPRGAYLFALTTRVAVDPYVPDSPLAKALLHCTVTLREGEECNLRQLPLLGMRHPEPTIDDVMERVLVSHEWMGVRFRQVLEALPPEFLQLVRPLTAIVISYDIRPSFYTTWTGAIYLDPDDLWLNQAERAVISTAADYRSSFGNQLRFTTLWRYVIHNEYATRPPTEGTRTVDDILYSMASLLYHELAHANDYFYPGRDLSTVMDRPLYRAADGVIPSRDLSAQYPLQSSILFGLGAVRYLGSTANATQKAYTPDDVAGEFTNDFASAFYSYSSEREDLAMLFEEMMMLYSFGVDRDVAVTNLPTTSQCADYIVAWGERNRVLDPGVWSRASYVAERILPDLAPRLEAFLADHAGTSRLMTPGVDWCANRYLDPSVPGSSEAARSLKVTPDETIEGLVPYL